MSQGPDIRFVSQRPDGATIRLRIQPKASRSAFGAPVADALKVFVAAPPEDGKANEELVRFLSKSLGLPRASLKIISGQRNKNKVVLAEGASADKLLESIKCMI